MSKINYSNFLLGKYKLNTCMTLIKFKFNFRSHKINQNILLMELKNNKIKLKICLEVFS